MKNELGKRVSVHGISPVFLQRAFIVIALSFIFFMAMMFAFYLRQNILYFLLATAFLLTYIFTMVSWVLQKRNVLTIFENGLTYKKIELFWPEIAEVRDDGEVLTHAGGKMMVPRSLNEFDTVLQFVRMKAALSE